MRSEDIDRALGATPPSFAQRMDQTLRDLKEEKEMKRAAFRTVLVVAVITALLCSTAYALVTQGLEWYYNERFPAYQQHAPEKHEAIMDHLQTEVPQTQTDDEAVSVAVTEVSWAPDQRVLVVSLEARAKEPDKAELHPMWNLDADGSYVGKESLADYSGDEEARSEHWLWTEDGYGPVAQMIAPGKQLLLLEADAVCLDGQRLLGDMSSVDVYVAGDGTVHAVLEIRLDCLEPDYVQEQEHLLALYPEQQFRRENIAVAKRLQALLDSADAMELTVPYTVRTYTEDDARLYGSGSTGEVAFTVKLR